MLAAYTITLIAILSALLPLAWILMISLKPQREAFALPPSLFFDPIFDNYAAVWRKEAFRAALLNSTIVSALGVAMAVSAAIPAAYALNRIPFRGKRAILIWLIIAYLLPEFLFIVPMYSLYQFLGLYDTRFGLAVVYQVFAMPFSVWMIQSFFLDVPRELDDAARIDGCGTLGTLRYVYLPMAAPGIAATCILTGIWMWNELAIALALTFRDAQTITVAVASFRGYTAIEWGPMTAASIISILPMLLAAAFLQRYIVKGLTLGAVK